MIGKGSAVIAWSAPTDSGFAFDSIGADRRECIDVDGFALVRMSRSRPASGGAREAEQQ